MFITQFASASAAVRRGVPDAPADGTITVAPVNGAADQFTVQFSALPYNGGAAIIRCRYQIVLRGGGGWTGAYDVTGGVVPETGTPYTVTLPAAQASKIGKSCDLRFWFVNNLSGGNGGFSEVLPVDLVPVLSSPADNATGQSTATYSLSTTGSTGLIYATRAASPPASGAAVKAASQVTGFPLTVTAAGTQTVNLTGLSASTTYDPVHFAHETDTGKLSLVSSADGFTTSSAPDVTNPTLIDFDYAIDDVTGLVTATLIFSEAISFNTGNIVFRENNGGWTDKATYNTASPPAQISISGDTLTIAPATAVVADRQYAFRVASTGIQDAVGNLYAGVADDTTLAFTAPSSADVTLTYTPGTGMQVYRAFDDMYNLGGWVRPQDENLSGQAFSFVGSPAGVSSNNGYLTINTDTVADDTFDYVVSWSDSVCDPGGGSFTWRVRRKVAYPTTMRIGHNTPVNTPTRGRAVAPETTTIISQTLSGSPVTLFAITDSGGHARLHFRTGESAPTPGAVYVVTLSNAAVVTVTIDAGVTVSTLTELNTAIGTALGGEIVYLREGRQVGNAPETLNGVGSQATIGRATDTANSQHVIITKHSDDAPPVIGKITIGGASAVQRLHFKELTFEANRSGNHQGAVNVFITNAKSQLIVEDCTFHGQWRVNGSEQISTSSNTNTRSYFSISGTDFTLRGCKIFDAREVVTLTAAGCTIEDNIFRRIIFDFIGTSRCEGLSVRGNRFADPLFAHVDMPLLSAPVAGAPSGGDPTLVFSVADASRVSGFGDPEDKAWAWGCRTASSDLYSYTAPGQIVAIDTASTPNTVTVAYGSAGPQSTASNLAANYTSGGILRAAASRLHGDFCQIGKPTPAPSTWASGTTYSLGDHVLYSGRYYTCAVASSTGVAPNLLTDWDNADFQSNITFEGNIFTRGTSIPGRTSGQGLYSARSEAPKVDWLVRGNLIHSLTDKGIYVLRMQGGQVVSNTSVTPLGTAATQFTTECSITVSAETGHTVDVYDNVATGISTTNATAANNHSIGSTLQFAWPERAADVTMYDDLFVTVPVREQTVTEAGFYDLFVGDPGDAVMFPSGQPALGYQGEFDPETLTYSGPR